MLRKYIALLFKYNTSFFHLFADSPEKFKAARNLTIPMTEPDKFGTELNLSALNALSLPDFAQSSESEDEH